MISSHHHHQQQQSWYAKRPGKQHTRRVAPGGTAKWRGPAAQSGRRRRSRATTTTTTSCRRCREPQLRKTRHRKDTQRWFWGECHGDKSYGTLPREHELQVVQNDVLHVVHLRPNPEPMRRRGAVMSKGNAHCREPAANADRGLTRRLRSTRTPWRRARSPPSSSRGSAGNRAAAPANPSTTTHSAPSKVADSTKNPNSPKY